MGGTALSPKPSVGGLKAIGSAVARIYAEGGVLAFWTGNGLSVMKIFPESAIKFLSYESSVSFTYPLNACGMILTHLTRNVLLLGTGTTSKTTETSVASVGLCLAESVE